MLIIPTTRLWYAPQWFPRVHKEVRIVFNRKQNMTTLHQGRVPNTKTDGETELLRVKTSLMSMMPTELYPPATGEPHIVGHKNIDNQSSNVMQKPSHCYQRVLGIASFS